MTRAASGTRRKATSATTATVQLSARLPRELHRELQSFASEHGISMSTALARLLKESVRMARHPGIDFRPAPVGRLPFVTGTGLAVWELYRIWSDHRSHARKVLKNYPTLTAAQLAAAVRYAEAYPEEIAADARRAQPERPKERFPFLKPFRA